MLIVSIRGGVIRVFGWCTLDELEQICLTLHPSERQPFACSSHLFSSSRGISHLGCLPANHLCREVRTFPTGCTVHMDDPPPTRSTQAESCLWNAQFCTYKCSSLRRSEHQLLFNKERHYRHYSNTFIMKENFTGIWGWNIICGLK